MPICKPGVVLLLANLLLVTQTVGCQMNRQPPDVTIDSVVITTEEVPPTLDPLFVLYDGGGIGTLDHPVTAQGLKEQLAGFAQRDQGVLRVHMVFDSEVTTSLAAFWHGLKTLKEATPEGLQPTIIIHSRILKSPLQ